MQLDQFIIDLMDLCPDCFINDENELILIPQTNLYFSLQDVYSKLDIQCKLLEWCSRDACKTMPFDSRWKNQTYQDEVRELINAYLKTSFTKEQMEEIYTYLGNAIRHEMTICFVQSGYDLHVLEEKDLLYQLYSSVLKRYHHELPDVSLNESEYDAIWFSLKGMLEREGEERAKEYAHHAKLNDFKKEFTKRGYV